MAYQRNDNPEKDPMELLIDQGLEGLPEAITALIEGRVTGQVSINGLMGIRIELAHFQESPGAHYLNQNYCTVQLKIKRIWMFFISLLIET